MPKEAEEDIIMTDNTLSFQICMDILDWFDDPYYDYLNHILIAKLDGKARVLGAAYHIRLLPRAGRCP